MKLRVLSKSDIAQALSMRACIEEMKAVFAQLSAGRAVVPLRTQLPVAQHRGVALFMPAYLAESGDLGAKIVSVFPDNLNRGLPTIHAIVVVLDAAAGVPLALLDGTYLTALRTGAASGAATELLARRDARVVAIFGAGTQGRTQLEGVCAVRSIERVLVFDSDPARAEQCVEDMRGRGTPIRADVRMAASPDEAVEQADIVCTATTSTRPVFRGEKLRRGTHVNAVGAYTPEMQEVDAETIQRAKVVVDSRQASLVEAGDIVVPLRQGLIGQSHIHAELGEIVAGLKPGRQTEDEITYFKSVGIAAQDVAAARLALREAAERGLGTVVEL